MEEATMLAYATHFPTRAPATPKKTAKKYLEHEHLFERTCTYPQGLDDRDSASSQITHSLSSRFQ
jgi:hypothetical protein